MLVYLLINNSEDIVIFLSEEEAIQASMKYSNHKIEIFRKIDSIGYLATYNYYKNGELYKYVN